MTGASWDNWETAGYVALPDAGAGHARQPHKRSRLRRICCLGSASLILAVVLSLVASVLQLRPILPLRILANAHCPPMAPQRVNSSVRSPVAAASFGSNLARPKLGLNLPPQQGTSYQANFLGPGTGAINPDGSYNYEYTDEQIEVVRNNIGAIRIGFNIYTARNATAIATIQRYFDAVQGRGGVNILAFWDTLERWELCSPFNKHGNGRVNDVDEAIRAWKTMHEIFGDRGDIMYEIFNEPYGYWTVSGYYQEMQSIIHGAGLPQERVILSSTLTFWQTAGWQSGYHWLGSADSGSNIPQLIALGWQGAFAYHHYPLYTPHGQRSVEGFAKKVLHDIYPAAKSHKIHISEIGASLRPECSDTPDDTFHGRRNTLLGFEAALRYIRANGGDIASAHWWFGSGGYTNDSYNVFSSSNGGRCSVARLASVINGVH